MIKNLMKTNVYDIDATIVIMGTCLPNMQPRAYEKLVNICDNILEICLEETHINMALSKIIGMLSRKKINKLIFATVDKSPHCIQLHYIENEIAKAMNLKDINIIHYVAVDNSLIEINENTISLSKNLVKLQSKL